MKKECVTCGRYFDHPVFRACSTYCFHNQPPPPIEPLDSVRAANIRRALEQTRANIRAMRGKK